MLRPSKNEVRKPTKTLAGVTPIAVMCKPKKCAHGTCLYCPSLRVPQSYTPKSPPVLRAHLLNYDPYKQVQARLKAYKLMNHPTDKIELIVMGGNFPEYPTRYKNWFIKRCYDAMNNKTSSTLRAAKKLNEKAKNRCVALCIESRPDTLIKNNEAINELLSYGCTRVELGVQAIDDKIYKRVCRSHGVQEVIDATFELKKAGFKIGYHMMLGLPGSNSEKDLKMFKKLFSDARFKPDQIKIYPCQVIKGAKLVSLHKQGKYKPYSQKKIQELIIKIMKIIPNYCRVMRVMREIPPDYLVAGTIRIDLRRDIEEEIKKRKLKINEIRFREIGFAMRDKGVVNRTLRIKITKYRAAEGQEYFLEIVNKDNILFGLCRLRVQGGQAFIREIHIYGQSLAIGQKAKQKTISQHRGLGKKLIAEAERIVKRHKIKTLSIISGVGVRQYYKKLGYRLVGDYMMKGL